MDRDEDKGRTAKDRKLFDLRKAVKCNWDKTNWQMRNGEKLLEDQLKKYREQRRKSIRLLEWRRYELEKRFMETKMARAKTKDEAEKNEKMVKDESCLGTQTETSGLQVRDSGSVDGNTITESIQKRSDGKVCYGDHRDFELSRNDQHTRLTGRNTIARQNLATESNRDLSNRLAHGLPYGDSRHGGKPAVARKVSSWENVRYEPEQAPFLPEIAGGKQRRLLMSSRSRSYTVGEKSNVYIPARERKRGVYQMQSIVTKGLIQTSNEEERSCSEKDFNLEDQFEKLQNCRYLRPSGTRK